jgi:hypothetical protein
LRRGRDSLSRIAAQQGPLLRARQPMDLVDLSDEDGNCMAT